MRVTVQQFQALFPKASASLAMPLNETFAEFDINTELRAAAFLAQAGHESANFTTFRENLNYSAQGLLATFPKYFHTLAEANKVARNPQKIANIVYANRMGNGSVASGDGYAFRGRGAIQLTGRATYTAFARDMQMTVSEAVSFCETPQGAIMSAGWYWGSRNLNRFCDARDFRGLTKAINGGYNGLDHREYLYEAALRVL